MTKHFDTQELCGRLNKSRGYETQEFFEKALSSKTEECVIWNYAKNELGYGRIMRDGKQGYVHRHMCAEAHGAAPSTKHVAEHLCGNNACINPRHLKWSTQSENIRRKVEHGTAQIGEKHYNAILTEKDVVKIRNLFSTGAYTKTALGSIFGVTRHAISDIISGRSWRSV